MSYRYLSPKNLEEHDLEWNCRSIEGELKSFENRTIGRIFDQYLSGTKAKIIEGGCGLGAWCEWFKQRGHEVVGIECNENIVARAKEFIPGSGVEYGDVTDLKYPDNFFDVYISLGVIEHFEHGPEQTLNEAWRILRPSGLAFVSTPCSNLLRRLILYPIRNLYFLIRKFLNQPIYFWQYNFTEKELRTYLEKAGFEIVYTDIDDYEPYERNRHLGIFADWFFLRRLRGEVWELNNLGRFVLRLLNTFPRSWYCNALVIVARTIKD